ncbi:MAG: N-acetylmuramoyl-L-alanine amidase [Melioribacteraceae bacterium]|nr:N-acetylmuramoyl-L-alanine amidase [Melioribacteraceae bacterium]
MNLKLLLGFLLLVVITVDAQRMLKISVSIDGGERTLSFVSRRGMTYVSSKELANILSGNYYYNSDASKVEMKFNNYSLKFTARTQFVIVSPRNSSEQKVYQIPISTMMINDDVFIPLAYCIDYVNTASERTLEFDDGRKHITVTGAYSTKPLAAEPDHDFKSTESKSSSSSGYDVYGLAIEEKSNGTLIRLRSKKEITKQSSSILNDQLILFLSGVSVDPKITSGISSTGLIRKVELKKIGVNTQVEFRLKEGFTSSEAFKDPDGNDLLITVHKNIVEEEKPELAGNKDDWKFDIVVIDAGHGGKDGGAVGVSGTLEKNINLKIALKLGALIEKEMNDVKVVYTRDDDTFVELFRRGKIANENSGKLFISIHCNSLRKKPSSARGFEVYLLRPGRTQEAINIAEFENSVIKYEENPNQYQKLTDENFILVSMAHSAFMRYSEKFSDLLNNHWQKNVGIPSRGIKQAGFFVLVGASMPGVLVETGFISNPEDEKYLNSSSGQQKIANAIFKSIAEYREYYDKMYEEED